MIVLDVEQGSMEWVRARIGIPTSSRFDNIVTPAKLAPSRSQETYLCELLAEWMMGETTDPFVGEWMERGHELEPQAVDYYEMHRNIDTQKVGFIYRDESRMTGCSPDRLVGDDGGLEIKCPSPKVHVQYMLEPARKYYCQVQGSLWITGRKWWDFLSFHPDMPPVIRRFERDEEAIKAISTHVGGFLTKLEAGRDRLVELGYMQEVA
jgi:exodeoxyribonuclease (lambda-induced)